MDKAAVEAERRGTRPAPGLVWRSRLFSALKHGIFPALFYLAAFALLTYPLIGRFSSAFFAGKTDGLQNVWNVWWVNLAVHHPELYPTIWYTRLLHWPFGTTLFGHTLNPFNGFLGVFLLSFLSLTPAYNTILVFAFVMAGVTMYWLAYFLTRSFWASLIAGFVFAFSSYHFSHYSQLQTASMEWIPLFILCWYALLTRPHPLLGLAAALALWLVILCDNYYFTYCLLSAILIVFWYAITGRSLRLLLRKEFIIPLLLFAGAALLLVGPQVRDLLISNYLDPLKGAHDPTIYSLDLLALIIPGGMWMFNHWTAAYWSRLPGNISENSVFLALPVLAFVVWLWVKRRSLDPAVQAQLYLWSSLFGGFFLLALGPLLHVGGTVVWSKFMPYALLSQALPFLSLSGVPARMAVMVILSAALLSAFALRELFSRFPHNRLLTLGLLGILVFEALPIPIMTTTVDVPGYVSALARLPNDGGVLDLTGAGAGYQLYYQTIHGKPIVGGYLARLPASVGFDDWKLSLAVQALDYARLWGMYHIRYIVAAEPLPIPSNQPYILLTLVYDQADARIYRIGCVCETQH